MNRRVFFAWFIFGLLAACAVLAAMKPVHAATPEEKAAAEVKIDNFSFSPTELTVAAGTTVTWVNQDDVPHTVVGTGGAFKSKALDTDDKFSFTFDKAGTYAYFCGVHPMMTGKIVVK
ncbi:MAG TPA: cupredoxin family copper-binding protein [Candidatus Acidoferrum sp.]|jgi:amicyanin|nr:cupredoxin family copper-binding protein [Candidatus Acidoferrum sp.]